MISEILHGYESAAGQLVPAFEALSSTEVLSPVMDVLNGSYGRTLDIGAGTGRDAAWLAARGHDVVAVEPVHQFRVAGICLHQSPRIQWVDDSLPHLNSVIESEAKFDLILVVGVWQHVSPNDRRAAMRSIRRLAAVNGRVVISVRHGPGAVTRPCFPTTDVETIEMAQKCGLALLDSRRALSIQKGNRDVGVTWTWLVLAAF